MRWPCAVNSFGIDGTLSRSIGVERNSASGIAGQSLTVTAGGAYSGGSNLAGGNLVLTGGVSTGTGTSGVQIQCYTAGASGTADNTATTVVQVGANSTGTTLGFYGATPVNRPVITGSKSSGAAWTSLLAALVALGLVVDSTTA